MQQLQEKVTYFNQIEEAHDIEATFWREVIMFIQCNYCKKKL